MKFLSLFAAGAAASALTQRDVTTVTDALAAISSATTQLQTQVQGFNGAGQVASLQSAAAAVLSAINKGNTAVGASAPLTGTEALQLPGPVNKLAGVVSDATDAAIAKKQAFVSAGVGGVVYDQLVMIRDASNTFTKTLLSKVPQGLQQIGMNLAAPISQSLDKAVAAYADQQGSGSGSGSASATSSGAATSSSSSVPTASAYPTGSSSAAASSSAPATSSSVVVVPTSTASVPAVGGTTPSESATPPQYTGAASHAAAGFGGIAVAALAAVAAF